MKTDITQEEIKRDLNYCPDTGIFTWARNKKHSQYKIGDLAGTLDPKGYLIIKINYKLYKAHRLAWLYVYGKWPEKLIDHINGKKNDNRICNLREADYSQNGQNQKKCSITSKTGLLGASYCKNTNKYRSYITVNGVYRHLGIFKTAQEAHERYIEAKKMLHPFSTI